jgi:uncharacterized damage-inducible protein DinB
MLRIARLTLTCLLLAPAAVAFAQDQAPAAAPQPNPLSAHQKFVYGVTKKILLRSADRMPEESYGFKPVDSVRSFGQIVGHLADSQYNFCSVVLGEKNPAPKVEKTRTSKADLIAALNEAFAYCDRAYDGMTDAAGAQVVKLMGSDAPKLGVLMVHAAHTMEHYGNLVTYLRMKDIVPPTSEPEFMRQMRP